MVWRVQQSAWTTIGGRTTGLTVRIFLVVWDSSHAHKRSYAVESSGSVDIYPGDVTAALSVALGTSAGTATVSTENTNVNFGKCPASKRHPIHPPLVCHPTGSFKVKFHGDASWLYNILLKLLQGTLRKAIAKAVNGALTNAINNECVLSRTSAYQALTSRRVVHLQRQQSARAHSP